MDGFRFDDSWLDVPTDDDRDAGSGGLPPEPPEERGERPEPPRRPAQPDPVTGPWFSASMAVFVAWGALSIVTMLAGAGGGEPAAWALTIAFLLLYVGFFVVGARWFGAWRRQ